MHNVWKVGSDDLPDWCPSIQKISCLSLNETSGFILDIGGYVCQLASLCFCLNSNKFVQINHNAKKTWNIMHAIYMPHETIIKFKLG